MQRVLASGEFENQRDENGKAQQAKGESNNPGLHPLVAAHHPDESLCDNDYDHDALKEPFEFYWLAVEVVGECGAARGGAGGG